MPYLVKTVPTSFTDATTYEFFCIVCINGEYESHLRHQRYLVSMNKKEKKREYNERILEVEQGSLTPLIFGTNVQCHAKIFEQTINLAGK